MIKTSILSKCLPDLRGFDQPADSSMLQNCISNFLITDGADQDQFRIKDISLPAAP